MSINTTSKSAAQAKLELKEVIENLKLLEKLQISDDQQLVDIKQKTEQLLNNLESKSLKSIKRNINKNQRKRRRQKLLKRRNQKNPTDAGFEIEAKPELKPSSSRLTNKPLERSRMYHHHLRSMHECQRFLKTFELLEELHLARGQDPSQTRKFSDKLQHLKLIWNSMLQEQQGEQSNSEQQEQQWNQVLFGVAEKTYFEGKPNLKYFLRKRHIWDSYIDNKYGTTIPVGWVFPPLKPTNDEWSQYLTK